MVTLVALARLLLNPPDTVWLVHRSTQAAWLAPLMEQNPQQRVLLELLEERDPRDTSLTTPLNLLERQLERLPPALLIWLEDRGPVFYVQQRSGWLGRTFQVFKLRTMQVAPPDAPPAWTMPGDQRITRVGLWLRRLRLDELPQLLNLAR